ncbi:DUF2798 domain-containing protein [Hymenobacter arizonensis]|uniref:DUF2798 domain-containing protein n=1 Tax=Hymenobacter arizonensis TaxID=1227077 RepID=A0A1I6BJZ9_HYMAR|nr:DUF2798 domain-containing protein [Hymenobacter arizonensis]SFQ81253.1 Protein of unknown function [Hymenobacter arizonensis]
MTIPKKYAPALTGLLMGLSMGLLISLVMTALHTPLGPGFLSAWLFSFAVGAGVGIPTALLLSPRVAALVQKITR